MTVLLHPKKSDPKRYRVWDRETKTQRYFPLTSDGKKDAEAYDRKIKQIKHARRLSAELGINKLFAEDGSVIGLKRKYRERPSRKPYECFTLYAVGKQTEFVIDGRGFEEAYALATAWLMKQHKADETYEIKNLFRQAKRFYWNSVR